MMETPEQRIEALSIQLNELLQQQQAANRQVLRLQAELNELKKQLNRENLEEPVASTSVPVQQQVKVVDTGVVLTAPSWKPPAENIPTAKRTDFPRSNKSLEELFGKNLASIIGILITIVGIFIGAKYAIEHQMVSPLLRIICGYVAGTALVIIAWRLRKKYEAYSAVLMGGGLSVFYFITYTAYSFYGLMPQLIAFMLMLVFTVATVWAAFVYNRVVIAHLGLVGAYAIPALLSDNSGRYQVLFTYIAIINAGILVVSFKKYWKSLFYAAYIITWAIFGGWYFSNYNGERHFGLALFFLTLYFLLFYGTFLAYKLIKKERYILSDVVLMLSNAFIFYGIGYNIFGLDRATGNWQGAFTMMNAAIHLVVGLVIRRMKLADTALYYLVMGLFLVFCTIAVPVQLDGNWVTLLWTAEAVLVFWIGRTQKVSLYEKLGMALVLLGFISLTDDWSRYYNSYMGDYTAGHVTPFANIVFLTGLLVLLAQAAIVYLHFAKKQDNPFSEGNHFRLFYDYGLPILTIVTAYFSFLLEIWGWLAQIAEGLDKNHVGSALAESVNVFSTICLVFYSIIFIGVLMLLNRQRIHSKVLARATLVLLAVATLALVFNILGLLNDQSVAYFHNNPPLYFGVVHWLIRYLIMAVVLLLWRHGQGLLREIDVPATQQGFALAGHAVVLSFLSAEYLLWARMAGSLNQYSIGLSVLWGLYALALVAYGIWKKQKHLRLAGIVLILVTLLKLFFYDLAEAGTLTKTICFISLGGIFLLISYLYNRYKEVLFDDNP